MDRQHDRRDGLPNGALHVQQHVYCRARLLDLCGRQHECAGHVQRQHAQYPGQLHFNSTGAAPGDVVVVQLVYAWPVVTGPLGFNITNLPNNQIQLTGVTAFRVEPYL